MRCPRCERESAAPASYCRTCGAPLRLREEATPEPLDAPLDLDRRGVLGAARRGAPAAEESGWDLGATAAGAHAEPTITAGAPVAESRPGRPDAPAAADGLPDPEVEALEVHVVRAATSRRVAAWMVDALPFAAGGLALARNLLGAAGEGLTPAGGLAGVLDLAARERVIVLSLVAAVAVTLAVYATLAHALAGATLGKWLLGLRVIGPDGARPSPARSASRSALALVSGALLGLGFLLALFTRSGRALHDVAARTWVVKAP